MSNKYGSITRTFILRNWYEDTLNPGTDVVLPSPVSMGVASNRFFPYFTRDTNKDTNYVVSRVGVFSNFADGLVLKNPADRIDVALSFSAYLEKESYSLNFTYGSKAVTLAAGTTGWGAGTLQQVLVSELPGRPGATARYIDATDAANGVLNDYWDQPSGARTCKNLQFVDGSTFLRFGLSALNCMINLNEFAQPFVFSTAQNYDAITLGGALNDDHTATFLTNIIDSSFADEKVIFDIVADVEFTGVDA